MRSARVAQAAASRQPVMVTTVYAAPLPWARRRYQSNRASSLCAKAGSSSVAVGLVEGLLLRPGDPVHLVDQQHVMSPPVVTPRPASADQCVVAMPPSTGMMAPVR